MGSYASYNAVSGEFSKYYYQTVAALNDLNVKIVTLAPNEKQNKPIEIAHSANSKYAVINNEKQLTQINVFDENKKKILQIDLNHVHVKLKEHVHIFGKNDKYHPPKDQYRPLNEEEENMVKRIREIVKGL